MGQVPGTNIKMLNSELGDLVTGQGMPDYSEVPRPSTTLEEADQKSDAVNLKYQ